MPPVRKKKSAGSARPTSRKKTPSDAAARKLDQCTECGVVAGKHTKSCSQYGPNQGIRPDPRIDMADLKALQQQFNDGDFSGARQLKEVCGYNANGECKNIAVIEKVLTSQCPTCEKSGKSTVDKFCLYHAIIVWGGGAPSRAQTSLV